MPRQCSECQSEEMLFFLTAHVGGIADGQIYFQISPKRTYFYTKKAGSSRTRISIYKGELLKSGFTHKTKGGCPWCYGCYDCYGVAARGVCGVGARTVKSEGKVDKAYRGNHYKNNDARRDTSWVRWKVFPSRGLSATAPQKM